MKTRNLVAVLVAAAFLPTLAHAGDNTDPIRASFDRAIYAGYFVESAPAAAADLLDAYVSPVVIKKQADVTGPQDVWSGAPYYYVGIELADTTGPQDAWSGAAYSFADTSSGLLNAYVASPAISLELAEAIGPQDVWSGAPYAYAGVELTAAVDPQDVWSGTASFTEVKLADAANLLEAYAG